jgi:nucleoside-diphosphate-sugar epimerase
LYNSKIHVGGEMNRHIACSIEKATRELDYTPKTDLEECVHASLDWCRTNGIEI